MECKQISSQQQIDRILAIVALVAIIVAWFIGDSRKEVELTPFLQQALPEAGRLEQVDGGYYAAWKEQPNKELMGYLAVGTAHGYGGALKMVVAVSPGGKILATVIADHKETTSFFQRVMKSDLLKSMIGKKHSDPFILEQDVDGVSGATYTSRALADAVRRGSRGITKDVLGLPTPGEAPLKIQFGFPEVFLIVLFVAAIIGSRRWFKYKKTLRWIGMLAALVVLGFIFSMPLTLIFLNKMLLGYWPQWQLHLYWYILIIGILLLLVFESKNLYCERICPFGAAQECVGVIGGAKKDLPGKFRTIMRWVQRVLALAVILVALVYSNPGIFTYEISGALFRLIGSTFLFALLGIILITALFIKRPWCNYLCPVRPVVDFIRLIRNWVLRRNS
jgi:uncharacterized protein with FMN-binding domain